MTRPKGAAWFCISIKRRGRGDAEEEIPAHKNLHFRQCIVARSSFIKREDEWTRGEEEKVDLSSNNRPTTTNIIKIVK
jgi:hypothetical protein